MGRPNRSYEWERWFASCTFADANCLDDKVERGRYQRWGTVYQKENPKSCRGSNRACRTRKLQSRSGSARVRFKNIYSVSICSLMSTREPKQLYECGGGAETSIDDGYVDNA